MEVLKNRSQVLPVVCREVMLEGIHGCCELRHFWQQVHDLLPSAK
jgi:hypothetical protein